jgi:hypothetical protein
LAQAVADPVIRPLANAIVGIVAVVDGFADQALRGVVGIGHAAHDAAGVGFFHARAHSAGIEAVVHRQQQGAGGGLLHQTRQAMAAVVAAIGANIHGIGTGVVWRHRTRRRSS